MDLIERMRAVAARTNDPLLLEAAAALEAAREESDRWRDRYRAAIVQARGKGLVPEAGQGGGDA